MNPSSQLLNRVLVESEFEAEDFPDQNWSGAELTEKMFTGCVFRNLAAPEAIFEGTVFEDCRFEGSDLTMIKVKGASFRDVEFERCKLMGIDWSEVRGLTFSVKFKKCVLSYSSFIDQRMRKTQFLDCKAHETNFAGVDLTGSTFDGCDLEGARFVGTNLSEVDLSNAINYLINPSDNTLRKTRYSMEAALALVSRLGVIVDSA
jgi:fluoroquinolone resistance protein